MWIVRLALRNPFSVGVLALVILILGVLSIASMQVDVFPVVDLPVVGIVWNYPGLSADDIERRIVNVNERAMSTTVSGISRIESQSIPSIANLRVYFQPGTQMGTAMAQVTATCQTILRTMPPGITPPNIFPFNASNVPVAQMTISSKTLSEEKLFDYTLNFLRLRLFTIPGLSTPAPYGGKQRQINVDVDPWRAAAEGVSTQDIVNTLQNSNIIIPAGDARIGNLDYNVFMNASPDIVQQFNEIPVKIVNHRPVMLSDVARIADAYADQTNIARINGQRATFLNILKKSDASTLTVINSMKAKIPQILAEAPKGMDIKVDFDQSVFVRASVESVIREAFIAAALVSLMILFFLGSWRSVIIVCTSIPLAILVGIIGLKITGDTLNIMTLGGLALSIGMLVDDATVEIENINRNIEETQASITVSILKAASQIALPAIVSTLAICIVFFPIGLLTGPAKFLFTPMAESVVFSMLASYILSRTLVPVLSRILLKNQTHEKEAHPSNHAHKPAHQNPGHRPGLKRAKAKPRKNIGERFNQWRERHFERLKKSYANLLTLLIAHRKFVLIVFALVFLVSIAIPVFVLGTDFFPTTDAGIMKLHFRAPTGTRLESTEKIVEQVENHIRKIIPEKELDTINSNIGVPLYYNIAFVPTDNVNQMDTEISIALKEDHHPSQGYMEKIRADLKNSFPGSAAYFQSADIVNQVLNFGLTSPIDVQIESRDFAKSQALAYDLQRRIESIPGTADVTIKQVFDYPTVRFNVDRTRAAEVGVSEKDVANTMLISLSSSSLTAPSFFVDPKTQVNYTVVVKVPLNKESSIQDLNATPITPPSAGSILQTDDTQVSALSQPYTETIGNLGSMENLTSLGEINHNNVQRVVDITANVDRRDLGGVVNDIQKQIDQLGKLPTGTHIYIRGQNEVMDESFTKLGLGMFLAVALVYLLMVTLFQSWLDPLIIMASIPGALIGVVWMLAITGTTINVESLMGTIMAIGIAVSNSNLMVVFANEIRTEREMSVAEAAVEAAETRLRPVLMTALAMILGMIPMALALGEGGEQNAPLGKAVIGGLIFATGATLLIVPLVYTLLRKDLPTKFILQEQFKKEEKAFDEEESHVHKVAT